MTLEELLKEWEKDAQIEKTELGDESLRIAKLHAKWLRILVEERLRQRRAKSKLKELTLEKHEFYSQGPTDETVKKGWKTPAIGRILKQDMPTYMDADPDIIKQEELVTYHQQIVDACELIMKAIQGRNWEIGRAIEWQKFISGA